MPDDLTDDERELLEKHRKAKQAKQRETDSQLRAWIRSPDGHEAELPFDKAADWLKKSFGLNLGDEPVQDDPGDVPDDEEPAKPRKLPYARRAG